MLKYCDLNISLEEDQSDEIGNIVQKLEEVAKPELEKVFEEADGENVGEAVRDIWKADLRSSKMEFFKDQQQNSMFCLSYTVWCFIF